SAWASPLARRWIASCRWCGVSAVGRPNFTPRSLARFLPSPVRARISSAAVIERRGLDMLQSSFGRRAREDRGWRTACGLLSCVLRLPSPCLALRRLAAPERFGNQRIGDDELGLG